MTNDNGNWFRRLIANDDGMESMEIAFSMGLIAAIAGFGMIILGDALFEFFEDAASDVNTANFPDQGSSTNVP
jgi:Flp pilus assembly pilin Flp